MKKNFVAFPALVLAVAALAQAQGQVPTKVAVIHAQQAIVTTKEGQKAFQSLQSKLAPKRSVLEKKQSDIAALQDQLKKGGATMSDPAKEKMQRDIETASKELQRGGEDFDAEAQQEEGKIVNDLGSKMMEVIVKYATQNGFAMVLDVSNQQSPVLWRDPSTDITDAIVKLYDQAHPDAGAGAAPATAAPKPAATTPAPAPKTPAAPPATKKP